MCSVKPDGIPQLCKTDEIGELCVCAIATGTSYYGLSGMTKNTFEVSLRKGTIQNLFFLAFFVFRRYFWRSLFTLIMGFFISDASFGRLKEVQYAIYSGAQFHLVPYKSLERHSPRTKEVAI